MCLFIKYFIHTYNCNCILLAQYITIKFIILIIMYFMYLCPTRTA